MTIAHLLNRTLAVTRPALGVDAYGGAAAVYSPAGEVAARVSRPSPAEREVANQEGVRITHEVYVQVGEDVRRGDLLTGDGQVLEVIAVTFPSKKAYLKVDCREDVPVKVATP